MNTENWNCLTTDNNEELFREYDGLVGLTLLNIWGLSKKDKVIRLYRFDRKNKEHLFVLRVALMARDLYQFPIEVDCSWWDVFCLNWKNRKKFDKVKKYKLIWDNLNNKEPINEPGVNVVMLLDFMRQDGLKRCGNNFSFSDIYEAYYEGGK